MEALFSVFLKVVSMIIMMILGWAITKKGMLTEAGTKEMSKILMHIVTPCLIISSFLSVESGSISNKDLWTSVLMSVVYFAVSIAMSYLFFRKKEMDRAKLLRLCIIFSNAGFMGMPLVNAIVGGEGVIYASFYITIFNIILWTYGYSSISGDKSFKIKNIITNPGIIGLVFGLPLFLFDINLPVVISEPVEFLADLNTPMAMIIVGSYVAGVNFKEFIKDKDVHFTTFARLILMPLISIVAFYIIGANETSFVSLVIQASAPVGTNCVLFAIVFKKDAKLASQTVAATTVLSVITIPIMAVLAQYVAALV